MVDHMSGSKRSQISMEDSIRKKRWRESLVNLQEATAEWTQTTTNTKTECNDEDLQTQVPDEQDVLVSCEGFVEKDENSEEILDSFDIGFPEADPHIYPLEAEHYEATANLDASLSHSLAEANCEDLDKDMIFESFDASVCSTLIFDCEVCFNCKCQRSAECIHNDGGSCVHCDYCMSGVDSDLECDVNSDDCYYDTEEGDELLSETQIMENKIRNDFIQIVHRQDIKQDTVGELLKFFRKHNFGKFPKSPKTLLKTPSQTVTRKVEPGEYWHHGLKESIMQFVMKTKCSSVKVSVNVDGLPLAKSSGACFWPICCSFNNSSEVCLAGVYYGCKKPLNSDDFLKEFVDELNDLIKSGIDHNGKNIPVEVYLFICDAPAKSFILNVKGHSGYFACLKCTVEGVKYGGRMAFLDLSCSLRSDESFIRQEQEDHHHGDTILTSLQGFLPVTNVVLDYMHLVLLGVMRKIMYMLVAGPLTVRQMGRTTQMSNLLESLAPWVPNDFARKTRSLDCVKRFKATEWRLILFYVGVVVFSVLPEHLYQHFLVLHVAMTILASPDFCHTYNDYAKSLIIYFIETFKKFYGIAYVGYNVHNLYHLPDDVRVHGIVDNFSAFKYENFLQQLKRMVRKGEKPLQQISRRYEEMKTKISEQQVTSHKEFVLNGLHSNGPLLPACCSPQFSSLCITKFGLNFNLSQANSCCKLKDDSIVVVENFAYSISDKSEVLIGRQFLSVQNVYTVPCESSQIGIHFVSHLSDLSSWPVNMIKSKCIRMPFKDGFAVVPLLHCGIQQSA